MAIINGYQTLNPNRDANRPKFSNISFVTLAHPTVSEHHVSGVNISNRGSGFALVNPDIKKIIGKGSGASGPSSHSGASSGGSHGGTITTKTKFSL